MAPCECGRPLGASGKLCARCDALRTLGLEHGASRNEIRDTYRDLVKVWHPDRFSNDGKLRSMAEEKLKAVNAAFQHLNSSADTTPARAASATKKPEEKAEAQKPYWTSKTSTRTYQWYSTSVPRSNASAPEPPRKDVSASGFPHAARPQSNGNAQPQSPTPEASYPIKAASQRLNSSANTPPARAASASRKPEVKAEAQKPHETSQTSTRPSQLSSAFRRETPRSTASAQEPPRKVVFAWGFPNAARPRPNGNALPQSPTLVAKRPINKGAPNALFSLRRISPLLVLALFAVFTQMWVNAYKRPAAAQDEIMNQYYEAEASKNALSQPTAQDEIMNLYYEVETRKNALSQLQSAPTEAENSVVAPSSSSLSPKQYLPKKRSSTTAVSAPLRSDALLPVQQSAALRNRVACRERSGGLNHHGDCRTR